MRSHDHAFSVPVLAYHQVEGTRNGPRTSPGLVVDPVSFRRQMFILSVLGYRTIGLDDLVKMLRRDLPLPRRSVVITFDDGYAGAYEWAFPILKRHGFTATLFLIAEDFREGTECKNERAFPIVSRAQVVEMLNAGLRIGSHSVSHPQLTDLSDIQLRNEITASKNILENAFGCDVTAFCYPYGIRDRRSEIQVEEAGYACACSTRFGRRHRVEDRFGLRRIAVGADQGLAEFVYRLLWARDE
jgi:peptidoglycan/xylan/chitin deacetylase (PgdA/CDA1 family)